MFNQNKRAQIAETTTWIVATLIIFVILIVTLFIASLMGHTKNLPQPLGADIFADKSLTAYLLTKGTNGIPIYTTISAEGQLNSFNGNLAKQIFLNFYS